MQTIIIIVIVIIVIISCIYGGLLLRKNLYERQKMESVVIFYAGKEYNDTIQPVELRVMDIEPQQDVKYWIPKTGAIKSLKIVKAYKDYKMILANTDGIAIGTLYLHKVRDIPNLEEEYGQIGGISIYKDDTPVLTIQFTSGIPSFTTKPTVTFTSTSTVTPTETLVSTPKA